MWYLSPAYLYNVVTHVPSFINDTLNLNIAWNEILILPNDPGNPYWNSSCNDCNGVVNGPALIDSRCLSASINI